MGFFLVLKAEIVRTLIITRRYWFATLMALIVGMFMFTTMLYLFLSGVAGGNLAAYATEKGLGLVIGIFAFSIVGMFSNGLASMARSGELEQVYMSPHGLITNFMARSAVNTVMSIITWTLLLVFVSSSFSRADRMAAAGNNAGPIPAVSAQAHGAESSEAAAPALPPAKPGPVLHVSAGPLAVLLGLTYFNMIGFGFMIGGLVLVFKQVGQVAVIIRLIMMAIAWSASEKLYTLHPVLQWIGHGVPVTDAAICLKLVLLRGYGYDIFTHMSFYCLVGNVALWTPIGLACFKAMENWARSKGTLGAF